MSRHAICERARLGLACQFCQVPSGYPCTCPGGVHFQRIYDARRMRLISRADFRRVVGRVTVVARGVVVPDPVAGAA